MPPPSDPDLVAELAEQARERGPLGGAERLEQSSLVCEVLGATAAFTAGAEQSDDITCLALTFRGAPTEG